MKKITALCALTALLLMHSCDEEVINEEPDTLEEHFSFKIDDEQFSFVENEMVSIRANKWLSFLTDEPEVCILHLDTDVQVANAEQEGTSYKHYNIIFNKRIPVDDVDSLIGGIPIINSTVLANVLDTGDKPFIYMNCEKYIYDHDVQVGIEFPFYDGKYGYSSFSYNCNEIEDYDQSTSKFTIQATTPYTHKQLGDGVVIEGTLEAFLYHMPVGMDVGETWDTLHVKNGNFKLFFPEVNEK